MGLCEYRLCTSELFHIWLKDRHATFIVVRLDLGVLFCLSASASSIFESLSVLFFIEVIHVHVEVDIFVQIGKRARGSSVIVFVTAFVGGRRSVNLRCCVVVVIFHVVGMSGRRRYWHCRYLNVSVNGCHGGSVRSWSTSTRIVLQRSINEHQYHQR